MNGVEAWRRGDCGFGVDGVGVSCLAALGDGGACGRRRWVARGRSASGGGTVCARRRLQMSEGAAARGVLVMACTGGGKVERRHWDECGGGLTRVRGGGGVKGERRERETEYAGERDI